MLASQEEAPWWVTCTAASVIGSIGHCVAEAAAGDQSHGRSPGISQLAPFSRSTLPSSARRCSTSHGRLGDQLRIADGLVEALTHSRKKTNRISTVFASA